MRVLLDDTLCTFEADTVGDAVAAGASLAEGGGRLIVEVLVDGASWTDEQFGSPEHALLRAEEVRLVSADRAELVTDAIEDAATSLTRVDELHRRAAEDLQADRLDEAMGALRDAITIWLTVQQAVQLAGQATGVELADIEAEGRPAPEVVDDLNELLREVRTSLQRQDPVGLADTLLYEFPRVIDGWRSLLTRLTPIARDGGG